MHLYLGDFKTKAGRSEVSAHVVLAQQGQSQPGPHSKDLFPNK